MQAFPGTVPQNLMSTWPTTPPWTWTAFTTRSTSPRQQSQLLPGLWRMSPSTAAPAPHTGTTEQWTPAPSRRTCTVNTHTKRTYTQTTASPATSPFQPAEKLDTMEHKAFTLSSWNIQGLRSSAFGLKSRNPDFIKEIGNTDIVILQETWYKGDWPTGCPLGYRELVVPSTKLPVVKQGRDSWGMLIWYRADLNHSIKLVKTGTFYIWLEMNKEMISTEKNVLMCATFIPPIESPYFNDDSFSILEREINNFQAQGHVLVCGDLNARTGQEPDTLSTQRDKHLPGSDSIPSPYSPLDIAMTT